MPDLLLLFFVFVQKRWNELSWKRAVPWPTPPVLYFKSLAWHEMVCIHDKIFILKQKGWVYQVFFLCNMFETFMVSGLVKVKIVSCAINGMAQNAINICMTY